MQSKDAILSLEAAHQEYKVPGGGPASAHICSGIRAGIGKEDIFLYPSKFFLLV